ncbi:MAG: S8 family serine peptidase [Promethearchaeota archaeon]
MPLFFSYTCSQYSLEYYFFNNNNFDHYSMLSTLPNLSALPNLPNLSILPTLPNFSNVNRSDNFELDKNMSNIEGNADFLDFKMLDINLNKISDNLEQKIESFNSNKSTFINEQNNRIQEYVYDRLKYDKIKYDNNSKIEDNNLPKMLKLIIITNKKSSKNKIIDFFKLEGVKIQIRSEFNDLRLTERELQTDLRDLPKQYSIKSSKISTEKSQTFNSSINLMAISILNLEELISSNDIKNLFSKFIHQFPETILIKEDIEATFQMVNYLPQIQIYPEIQENYGYKGDNYSSIAFIDSGIDETHPMVYGYGDKDPSKKIIGWVDFTSDNSTTPTDSTEHGTFCASIAAGLPYDSLDDQNRTVVSSTLYRNWRGLNVDMYYIDTILSFNVSAPGVILANGTWEIGDEFSGAEVKNITIIGPDGNYKANATIPAQKINTIVQYSVSESELGIYKVGYIFKINQTLEKDYILYTDVHFPRNRTIDLGKYRGVAPESKIVMLKAYSESEILNAINWILQNGKEYNITTVNMSFKIPSSLVRTATEQLIDNGFIVVAAAGNDYGDTGNTAGSFENTPGSIDRVISVGAIDNFNHISSYSSGGGPTLSGNTIKPDCVAPGGEFPTKNYNFLPIIAADSNAFDSYGSFYNSIPDRFANDLKSDEGTSFSSAFLSGAIQLIIQALGGVSKWNYTEQEVLWLKSLLLMSATEIAPNPRNLPGDYNPILNRGDKDIHEGYGRINPKTAIDMLQNQFVLNSTLNGILISTNETTQNNFPNPAWGRKIELNSQYYYKVNLTVPSTADFDVYIYKNDSTPEGDPILVSKGASSGLGVDETFQFSVMENGTYYVIVKAIQGHGSFNISINSFLDTIKPYKADVYSPSSFSYLHLTIEFSVLFQDNETGVHKIRLYFIQLDNNNYSIPIKSIDPWEISYSNFFNFNTKSLEDGWYNLTLSAIDGNGNALNSTTLTLCIDNTAPNLVQIISPKSGTKIHKTILIKAIASDELSGIDKVSFHIDSRDPTKVFEEYSQLNLYQYYLKTNRSDDGLRYIWIEAYDKANNGNSSLKILITINNQQIEIEYTILFMIITAIIFSISYVISKQILLKIDFEEIFEIPYKILRKIQSHLAEQNYKNTQNRKKNKKKVKSCSVKTSKNLITKD